MIRVYHGGPLDRLSGSLWTTVDPDYAAAFAQLHDAALWMITLDVDPSDVLDLRGCGLDVTAVATDLAFAGIPVSTRADDERHHQKVLRRVSPNAIRAAGYRVVRSQEWIDWGAGERHAESVLIVDVTVICDREVLPLADRNFQLPDHHDASHEGGGLVCPSCLKPQGDVAAVTETQIAFRCRRCGHRWSTT